MIELADIMKTWCARHGIVLARYHSAERRERLQHFLRLRKDGRLWQNPADACQLVCALQATRGVAGEIAEVGTALGGSARLIAEYAGDRQIHVYDTFEGLPKPGEQDRQFAEGQYETNFDEVKNYLSGLRVSFHKGVFPESAEGMKDVRFSFVHLDVDLYKSTYEALEFFYPRMTAGGILISHDYVSSQGVTQSFADFFKDKPETPIELIGYQAMFVKLS
jgi:O-methyltransferase